MPFRIPNEGDAGNPDQAEPDSVDFDIIIAAFVQDGVVSGCEVTAQGPATLTVDVAAGTIRIAGTNGSITGTTVTHGAADATRARFDLIVVGTGDVVAVVAGTPSTNPVFPAIPASRAVLAAIYIPAGAVAVETGQITDKRIIVTDAVTAHVAAADPHTQYLLASGTRQLTGNWDAGPFNIAAANLQVTAASGKLTMPLSGRIGTPSSNNITFAASETAANIAFGVDQIDLNATVVRLRSSALRAEALTIEAINSGGSVVGVPFRLRDSADATQGGGVLDVNGLERVVAHSASPFVRMTGSATSTDVILRILNSAGTVSWNITDRDINFDGPAFPPIFPTVSIEGVANITLGVSGPRLDPRIGVNVAVDASARVRVSEDAVLSGSALLLDFRLSSTQGGNVASLRSIDVLGSHNATGFTLTEFTLLALRARPISGGVVTDFRTIHINTEVGISPTNVHGIDIENLPSGGTLSIGIRQRQSTHHNRFVGPVRIGSDATPVEDLEVADKMGWEDATGFLARFTHANTAARDYSFPDRAGIVAVEVKSGNVSVTEGTATTVTFATAFASTPNVVATIVSTVLNAEAAMVSNISSTSFDIIIEKHTGGGNITRTVEWIATIVGDP